MSDTHAESVGFVRRSEIPPSPPPALERGVVKWTRENLFKGWVNSAMTVLALVAVYYLARWALPWLLNGVWDAESIRDCRTQLEGATGGCFAVITERWHQLVFGRYPQDQYWRPILAFLLVFVAAAPVLFTSVPRKMLYVTAVFPFLAYWLVWGGTVLVPLVALAGVVAGYFAYRAVVDRSFVLGLVAGLVTAVLVWSLGNALISGSGPSVLFDFGNWAWWLANGVGLVLAAAVFAVVSRRENALVAVAVAVAVFAVWWVWVSPLLEVRLLLAFGTPSEAGLLVSSGGGLGNFLALDPVPSRRIGGFMLNFILGVTCVSLSLPLGIALALGRQSDLPIIKFICVGFIEFIRGVPLITLLFVANVVLAYFLPPGTNFDLVLRVVIMITLFSGAYIAEVIRGGLAALPRGQYEAADALGLDYWQATRLIIMPQALKISIPGIVNVAIGLFKDTTLVSIISMFDLVGMIRGPILAATEWNGVYWELFGFAAVLFFVVCYGISQYSQYLERKLATDHR